MKIKLLLPLTLLCFSTNSFALFDTPAIAALTIAVNTGNATTATLLADIIANTLVTANAATAASIADEAHVLEIVTTLNYGMSSIVNANNKNARAQINVLREIIQSQLSKQFIISSQQDTAEQKREGVDLQQKMKETATGCLAASRADNLIVSDAVSSTTQKNNINENDKRNNGKVKKTILAVANLTRVTDKSDTAKIFSITKAITKNAVLNVNNLFEPSPIFNGGQNQTVNGKTIKTPTKEDVNKEIIAVLTNPFPAQNIGGDYTGTERLVAQHNLDTYNNRVSLTQNVLGRVQKSYQRTAKLGTWAEELAKRTKLDMPVAAKSVNVYISTQLKSIKADAYGKKHVSESDMLKWETGARYSNPVWVNNVHGYSSEVEVLKEQVLMLSQSNFMQNKILERLEDISRLMAVQVAMRAEDKFKQK